MKTILLIGKNGQIGWELQRSLSPLGKIVAVDRHTCDLASPRSIRDCIREIKPQIIINAAAYTSVDEAEDHLQLAVAINAVAPEILAEEAKKIHAALIHYSTDYVFDGTSTIPYQENDLPNPVNVYGKTKLSGEKAIIAIGGSYVILRTSWVYGGRGRNFLLTMLKLGAEKDRLCVVDDQFGTPNWSRHIAEATAFLVNKIDTNIAEIFHLSGLEKTSWYEFAKEIFFLAKAEKQIQITPISTKEFPRPAIRPAYSVLDSTKLNATFGLQLPSWKETLSLAMDSINGMH